jgi:hypothetical protein
VQNLLEKLGVHSKTEAAGLVLRQAFDVAAPPETLRPPADPLRVARRA